MIEVFFKLHIINMADSPNHLTKGTVTKEKYSMFVGIFLPCTFVYGGKHNEHNAHIELTLQVSVARCH